MRDITVDFFDTLKKIPTMLRYFYLKPDNYVIVSANAPFDLKFKIWADDSGKFHKYNMNTDYDYLDYELTVDDLIAIIYQVQSQKSTLADYDFKTKWEEIVALASAYIPGNLISSR